MWVLDFQIYKVMYVLMTVKVKTSGGQRGLWDTRVEIKGGGGYEAWGGRCSKNVHEKSFIIKKAGTAGPGGPRGGSPGGRDQLISLS